MKKKFNPLLLIVSLVIILSAGYLLYDNFFRVKFEEIPYSVFYKNVQDGYKYQNVTITENNIKFTDPINNITFITQNPHSPFLEEELLKKGISVTIEKNFTDILSIVFDILFYGIFFTAIIFVFKKFISPNTFKVQHNTGVKFDDVVGMETLKQDMTQIIHIMKNPVEYAKRGIRMPKGILLEGAPGNGKTLFAKALAGEAKVNFIPAKATDFESMFMAIGPMKVKLLFKKARRNYSGSAIETENTRIVTALLNELDGFEPASGILVLAATNSIEALDEALIRPGRFDSKFSVPYPDDNDRVKLCTMYCKNKSPDSQCTPEVLSNLFKGFSCARIETVLNKAALISVQKGKKDFSLQDVNEAIKSV